MFSYCDCRNSKRKVDLKNAGNGRNKMTLTKANKDGTCEYCGYIVHWSRHMIEDAPKQSSVTGVSGYIKAEREERGFSDTERTDKNGNLDV